MAMSTSSAPAPVNLKRLGFTIIEMMVAVAIGMILIVVITNLISRHEATRRSLTSGNESTLSASFVSYALDREIRSAGSGFSHDRGVAYGCLLRAKRNNVQLLPSPAALPAPFAGLPLNLVLAPAMAHPGIGAGGSDVLVINSGTSGMAEIGMKMRPLSASTTQMRFENTIGLRGNDVILMFDAGNGCLIEEVKAPFSGGVDPITGLVIDTVDLAGTYYSADVAGRNLVDFKGARVSNIGNSVNNPPRFLAFGLDTNSRLMSYDLLQTDGNTAPQLLADGVLDMRIRYGVDTTVPDADGALDTWLAPTNAAYTPGALAAGGFRSIGRVMAVRVGLIVRGDLTERDNISPETITLFSTLPAALQVTRTLSADERRQRVRVVEFTIPIRNAMFVNRI